MNWEAVVITLSDRCYRGEMEDIGGPVVEEALREAGYRIKNRILLSDDKDKLKSTLIDLVDNEQINLIVTTGGTGFSPRDNAPEATLEVADKLVPGIAEAARVYSMSKTPKAMLSRAVSVIRKRTLIINLPGSPRACKEILEYILPTLEHGMDILAGIPEDEAKG